MTNQKNIFLISVIPFVPKSILITNKQMCDFGKNGYHPLYTCFSPCDHIPPESNYRVVNIKLGEFSCVRFGITVHAYDRMNQRGITLNMLKHTLTHGKIEQEGPQRTWDVDGRKTYCFNGMTVISNFEQNRIITVFWNIPNWDQMDRQSKDSKQQLSKILWTQNFK